jgi:FlaA1/EpsC-like NDP-sugar epimerase
MVQLRRINIQHFLADNFILVLATTLSFIVFDANYLREEFFNLLPSAISLWVFKLLMLGMFGATTMVWRYFSVSDSLRILRATSISLCVSLIVVFLQAAPWRISRFLIVDFIFTTALLCGFRLWRRVFVESKKPEVLNGKRTLIIGAGQIGRSLGVRFQNDSIPGFRVVGFVDDDKDKIGRFIAGIRVLGNKSDLGRLIKDLQIQEVIIAISDPEGATIREIFGQCLEHQIRPRTVSRMSALRPKIETLREIELSDLLFRTTQNLDLGLMRKFLVGKTVLITGAGGSIGSELARQVNSQNPKKVVLLDHSEFNLYQIDAELRVTDGQTSVVPVLADIKDPKALEHLFRTHQPDIVIHAAAYKHVHLVEANPHTAFLNNVLGTKNLADLSDKYLVKNFVLISSDKAVNPVGFMGATKRVCELIIAQKSLRSNVRFCAVRFGNVLGSSGSLVPLLQKQIENGGPVTITHPDMARYFMLIPEAVSLVLTAATLAKSGDILILKMGQPVKIVDLAKNLIRLNLKTEAEIPILFTGIRQGEKLVEELYLCGNEIETNHPEILIAPAGDSTRITHLEQFWQELDRVLTLASENRTNLVDEVKSLIANDPRVVRTVRSSEMQPAELS